MFKTQFASFALSAVLGVAALASAPTSADAMEIYNCTADHLPVAISHVPSGQRYQSVNLAPGRGASWNTGRGDGFRVSINVIGPDKRFSGRNGGEVISIVTMAGNTELVAGKQCAQPAAQTSPSVRNTASTGGASFEEALAIGLIGVLLGEATKRR